MKKKTNNNVTAKLEPIGTPMTPEEEEKVEDMLAEKVKGDVIATADADRIIQIKAEMKNLMLRQEGIALTMASRIYEIDKKELYKLDGAYSSTAKWAEGELGLAKSTVSEVLKVMKRFSAKGTFSLPNKYRDFGIGKLVKMTALTELEENRIKLTPEMTRQQIVDSIKEFKDLKKWALSDTVIQEALLKAVDKSPESAEYEELKQFKKDWEDAHKESKEENSADEPIERSNEESSTDEPVDGSDEDTAKDVSISPSKEKATIFVDISALSDTEYIEDLHSRLSSALESMQGGELKEIVFKVN